MRNRLIGSWLAGTVLLFAGGCNSTAPSTASNGANPAPGASNSAAQTAPAPAPAPPVVVPADTTLTVTIDQAVSTKTSNTGDRFEASLAAPVRVEGNEV